MPGRGAAIRCVCRWENARSGGLRRQPSWSAHHASDRPARAVSRTQERGCHPQGAGATESWGEAGLKRGRSPRSRKEVCLSGSLCTPGGSEQVEGDGCLGPAAPGSQRTGLGLGTSGCWIKLTPPSHPRILFTCHVFVILLLSPTPSPHPLSPLVMLVTPQRCFSSWGQGPCVRPPRQGLPPTVQGVSHRPLVSQKASNPETHLKRPHNGNSSPAQVRDRAGGTKGWLDARVHQGPRSKPCTILTAGGQAFRNHCMWKTGWEVFRGE